LARAQTVLFCILLPNDQTNANFGDVRFIPQVVEFQPFFFRGNQLAAHAMQATNPQPQKAVPQIKRISGMLMTAPWAKRYHRKLTHATNTSRTIPTHVQVIFI
jgi:hypothetical protein